jgi:hypothetical protein
MKRVNLVCMALVVMAYGCNSCRNKVLDMSIGVKDLGNGYYFTGGSVYEANIVFTEKSSYQGIGSEVIPPTVNNFNSDQNYIIVRSRSDSVCYWIIDKSKPVNLGNVKSNVLGPLNSSAFINILKSKNISLDFSSPDYGKN